MSQTVGSRQRKRVITYSDFQASGMLRLLYLNDGTFSPEIAIYLPKIGAGIESALENAGFVEEAMGKYPDEEIFPRGRKFVLRTDKCTIIVYSVK
jgi:hypothetical protein